MATKQRKRDTAKHRKRMKRQRYKQHQQFNILNDSVEVKAYYACLEERRKQREAEKLERRKQLKALVDSLANLYWQRRIQEDPEVAKAEFSFARMEQMLNVVGWEMGSIWNIASPTSRFMCIPIPALWTMK